MVRMRFLATAAVLLCCFSCEKTSPPEEAASSSAVEAIAAAAHMSSVLILSVSTVKDEVHFNFLDEPMTRRELESKLSELAEFDSAIRIRIEPQAGVSDDLLEEIAQLIDKAGLRVWTVDEPHEQDAK